MTPELQPLLLITAGAVFALLLLLNVLFKTLAGREKIGFIDVFLTFLTTALLVLALVFDFQVAPTGQALVTTGARVIAAVLAGFSLLIMLLELRRPQRLRDSRGVLMLWAGLLVVLSTFTVPIIATNLVTTPEAVTVAGLIATPQPAPDTTAEAGSVNAQPTRAAATQTPTDAPTATVSATPTQAPTERPSATATPTRERFTFSTPTPEPSATLPSPCIGTVPYNVRLRALPDTESETLATIPFETTIAIYGKDASNAAWWYTEYDGAYGWVDAEFVQATSACSSLPIRPVD